MFLSFKRLLLLLWIFVGSFAGFAQGADFTSGADYNSGSVTLWFKSQVNTTWVDAHYTLTGGAQQNVRMSWNAGRARFETRFPGAAGQGLKYWFTYNNGQPAYDSASASTVIGGSSASSSSASSASSSAGASSSSSGGSAGASYKAGVELSGTSATLWFVSHVNTSWVDAHYTLAGGGQQNVRMRWNAARSRYEWSFAAQGGQTLRYWFTYNNGTPAIDSPALAVVLGAGAGSSASSASSVSSSSSSAGSIPVGSRTMTIQLKNATRGNFADSQLYWAVIGLNPQTKAMSYVTRDGSIRAVALADNDAAGRLSKGGVNYANYFHTVADVPWVSIPPLEGARIFLSAGSPMYIRIVAGADGRLGFAGPDLGNPLDPNQQLYFDFVEFTLLSTGFWGNTTRVDQFGFPLTMRLVGRDGVDRTVGETETRAALFSAFQREVPDAFQGLLKAPYRIVAPGKGTMAPGAPHASYFDSYINEIWDYYRNNDLRFSFEDQGAMSSFVGRVSGDTFVFSKNNGADYAYIRGKPSTLNVLEGSGPLATGSRLDLVVQAQICAALNRHLVKRVAGDKWSDASTYYAAAPANYYAKFWHQHSIDALAYGFAYDDVRDKSTLLYSSKPQGLVVSIGW